MFRCDICDQEFKNETSYQKHLLTSKHITNKTIHDLKHQIEDLENEIKELKEKNENLLINSEKLYELNELNKDIVQSNIDSKNKKKIFFVY